MQIERTLRNFNLFLDVFQTSLNTIQKNTSKDVLGRVA